MAAATPPPMSTESRRRTIRVPRPLWFFLPTVVLIVLAVGLRFGVPVYRQQVAIDEIERLGGTVQMRPRGPVWLRDRVGDKRMKLFDEVVGLYLRDSRATDATLGHVRCFTGLQGLWISNTHVTDAGLAQLKGLTRLKRLSLANTQVTDGGLVHLKELIGLQEIWLENTEVTDAGLTHLNGLTGMQGLWLDNTQVTDAGVAELQRALPGLTVGALTMNR